MIRAQLNSVPRRFIKFARASLCATYFAKLHNRHILSPLPYYINITYFALTDAILLRFTYLTLFLFAREAPGLRNVSFNGEKFAKLEHETQYVEYFLHKRSASLAKVVQRLLACHATSCATERGLWGSVYSGSRHALGKKLITICANSC
jgi:hypothetical protein